MRVVYHANIKLVVTIHHVQYQTVDVSWLCHYTVTLDYKVEPWVARSSVVSPFLSSDFFKTPRCAISRSSILVSLKIQSPSAIYVLDTMQHRNRWYWQCHIDIISPSSNTILINFIRSCLQQRCLTMVSISTISNGYQFANVNNRSY